MNRPQEELTKEAPLLENIRLLGRILGDVIREQEGEQTFQLIENIRRLAVAEQSSKETRKGEQLNALLQGLTGEQSVKVVCAFTYFSLLANLAEDQHYLRRREIHDRLGDKAPSSLAGALEKLQENHVDKQQILKMLQHAYISPVLTAHPTEVQRKSILDAEKTIAELLAQRSGYLDQLHTSTQPDVRLPKRLATNEQGLRAGVTQLWQTRLLRYSRLTVEDEIYNALSYYQTTFLQEVPLLYAHLEQILESDSIPSFFHMGQWIGGDRDGNQNVTAQTLRYALRHQAEMALQNYLKQVHLLGSELSMSECRVSVDQELLDLAKNSGDTNPHRSFD